ncbi:glutathione S-transferase family protein [Comamonas sp. NoAH]|uniref:glutathione S-transferase family protein n=1 Tax=Comamonas halotolerans TaxID=3041496 RepID=UPI0024E0CB17|nr:glutathione S-transferase N-terminal domain-containing protein [Comamonas sp. NoAH]
MQLFLNATSPFARVVRVITLEKGLVDRVNLVWTDPWSNDPALLAQHPQARIPVLVTEEGSAIAESLLIAQYLDHIGSGARLVPPEQMAAVLAHTSVAYGLMEATFQVVIARKYEGETADNSVLGQRRLAAIARALQTLEDTPPQPLGTRITLAQIMAAVAIEYLLFRLPALCPVARYPQLHAWLQPLRQRPSIASTCFE